MALCDLLAVDCCLFIYGPANMTHKLSSACAETILSYHNSLQQNCFTHKLEPVTSPWCVCVVVCVLCGSLFCLFVCLGLFLVCFLFFLLFAFCSLCFGFCTRNVTRDLDYVSVLYQFTFAAITASAPARVN